MAPENYFILVYDIPSRELEVHDFEHDYKSAASAYTDIERQRRDEAGIEVLLVGADSIETIKTTHSHYFAERADDLFKHFLEDMTPAGGRVLARTRGKKRHRRAH